jgi:hypothetical protein
MADMDYGGRPPLPPEFFREPKWRVVAFVHEVTEPVFWMTAPLADADIGVFLLDHAVRVTATTGI